jgi:hypothetical protein
MTGNGRGSPDFAGSAGFWASAWVLDSTVTFGGGSGTVGAAGVDGGVMFGGGKSGISVVATAGRTGAAASGKYFPFGRAGCGAGAAADAGRIG